MPLDGILSSANYGVGGFGCPGSGRDAPLLDRSALYCAKLPLRNDSIEFAPATTHDGMTTPHHAMRDGHSPVLTYCAKLVLREVPAPTATNASPLMMMIPVFSFMSVFGFQRVVHVDFKQTPDRLRVVPQQLQLIGLVLNDGFQPSKALSV